MPEETQLLERFQDGDSRALSELYDRYSGAIYATLLRMCSDSDLANDALQETFISIWQNRERYDPDKGRFYTWAYRIGRNKMLNFLRNSPDLIQNEDLGVYEDKVSADAPNVDLPQLQGALATLEPHHQRALELVYFSGLTHQQAHQEMEVPLGTFKSYVRQALKALRKAYGETTVIALMLMDKMM